MTPQRMTLRKWKRIQKGALIGVAGIALPFGGSWLDLDDVPILMTKGKAWATWQGKPVVAQDGRIARLPGTGAIPKSVNDFPRPSSSWSELRIPARSTGLRREPAGVECRSRRRRRLIPNC
jgi:hypothetical protein